MFVRAHKSSQAIVFVIMGLALTIGGATWLTNHGTDLGYVWIFAGLIAIFVVALGVVYGRNADPPETRTFVTSRPPLDAAVVVPTTMPSTTIGTAYRGMTVARERIVTGAKRVLSPVSATWTVASILACSVLTAVALPALFAMPRWIEVEIVLGTWWLLWAVVLGVLAHRGQPLDRDYALTAQTPASGEKKPKREPVHPFEPKKSRWSWLDVLGLASDGEGLVLLVVGAIVVGLAIVATTVVVDVAAPLVFLVAFTGVQIALRRSLAASHRGQKLRSAAHGMAWATCYVAPLAAVVGLVHVVLTP